MANNKNQHVVPHGDGWAVEGEGNEQASFVFETKEEAVAKGRQVAMNQNSELIIHNQDGSISARDSYGNDPFPPRDSEH